MDYYNQKKQIKLVKQIVSTSIGGSENEEESKVLKRSDITKLGLLSSFLQASFNYERMQAGGFLLAMLPALKKKFIRIISWRIICSDEG